MPPKQPKQPKPVHRSGWRSTKLHLALIVMVLTTGVYAFIGFPKDLFTGYCVTLLSAAGIFAGTRTVESALHRNDPS